MTTSQIKLRSSESGIWLVLAAASLISALTVPAFRDVENLANIVKQSAILGLLAVGQTFVIVAGMVDLSMGMATGLVVVLTCALTNGDSGATLPIALLMVVGGLGLGLWNGYLIQRLKVHSVIFTFGMLSILQGLIFTYSDISVGSASRLLAQLANGSAFGVPVAALILGVVAVCAHILLSRTRFGYHLMAAGGNVQSAERSGIDVTRVRIVAFMLAGVSASLAGLLLAGRLGTGYPMAGANLELDAVVAVVLGGTALAGGRGSIANSVGGVLLLTLISNVLNLLGISSFVQIFLKGAIVVLAMLINQMGRKQS